ncbi:LysM peptidoglycan-binding domain-containing protein [Leifsonia shinshuensis]
MRKFFAGIGALIAIIAVLVGVPAVLIAAAGNPLPTPEQITSVLSLTPDYGNIIFFTKVLPLIGWLAWLFFAIPFLVEIVAAVAGRQTAKRSPLFKGQQRLAATLVAAVLVMFAGGAGAIALPGAATAAEGHTTVAATQTLMAPVETPASQPAPSATPQQQEVTHTVQSGDTLWDLSQQYLGDGAKYNEIYQASAEINQPDGRHLTDPDLIVPGWTLDIPTAQAAPAVPEPAPEPAPAPTQSSQGSAPSTSTTGGAAETSTPTSTPDTGSSATPSTAATAPATTQSLPPRQGEGTSTQAQPAANSDEDLSESAIPLLTVGGIGALLAAGLLAALGRRRQNQRRKRHAGERIAMPTGPSADLELELRLVERPMDRDDIDDALRSLQIWAEDTGATLPKLFAIRLESSEIALYLTEPADLPDPFVPAHPDHTAWIVKPGTATPPARATVSPYPALTSIGTDARNGVLLLDLEQIGALTVAGDEETAKGVLNAIAVELAENPWSDQIQVTLVGMPEGLARDLNRFRISHVDDVEALIRNIRNDLRERGDALASFGIDDIHDARAHAGEAESWAPHVVILGQAPSAELQAQLNELVEQVPRLGVATVANNGVPAVSGSTVRILSRDAAELISSGDVMPPLPFRPQVLAGRELELVEELFATTRQAPVQHDVAASEQPVPAEAESRGVDEPLLEDISSEAVAEDVPVEASSELEDRTTSEDDLEIVAADSADAAPEPLEDAAHIVEPVTAVTETVLNGIDEPVGAASSNSATEAPDWPAPYVRLLGPVDALHVADTEGMPGRGVELMAYLLLNAPVEGKQLQMAFWPDTTNAANNQRQLAKKVRLALGHTPEGDLLLPENVNHQGYTLHPAIRSDWDDFRDLIGADLRQTSNEDLIAAIKLVRGAPFAGCNTRRWWQWISIAQEEMIASVMDAADELARRALAAHDRDQARYAAKIAQAVDPLNEAGWRAEMRAALQAGDMDGFRSIVDDMYARVGGDDPEYEPDLETEELVSSHTVGGRR